MNSQIPSHTQTDCQGYHCTVEKTLPFAGPLLALVGMLVVATTTTAAVMMMAG